jgi:hypothetical protein
LYDVGDDVPSLCYLESRIHSNKSFYKCQKTLLEITLLQSNFHQITHPLWFTPTLSLLEFFDTTRKQTTFEKIKYGLRRTKTDKRLFLLVIPSPSGQTFYHNVENMSTTTYYSSFAPNASNSSGFNQRPHPQRRTDRTQRGTLALYPNTIQIDILSFRMLSSSSA